MDATEEKKLYSSWALDQWLSAGPAHAGRILGRHPELIKPVLEQIFLSVLTDTLDPRFLDSATQDENKRIWFAVRWCLFVLSLGREPQLLLEELANVPGARARCATKWEAKHTAYRCRDCGYTENSCMCVGCFNVEDHKGHDYFLYQSELGGCCDCGDVDAWKPSGFCSSHSGKVPVNTAAGLPADLVTRGSAVFNVMSGTFMKLLRRLQALKHTSADHMDDRDPTNDFEATYNYLSGIAMCLQELCSYNDGMRHLICLEFLRPAPGTGDRRPLHPKCQYAELISRDVYDDIDLQTLTAHAPHLPRVTRPRLDDLSDPVPVRDELRHFLDEMLCVGFEVEMRTETLLTTFYLELMFDPTFKEEFAISFVCLYPKYLSDMLARPYIRHSLDKITVQIFTNQALALKLIEDYALLEVLVISCSAVFLTASQKEALPVRDGTAKLRSGAVPIKADSFHGHDAKQSVADVRPAQPLIQRVDKPNYKLDWKHEMLSDSMFWWQVVHDLRFIFTYPALAGKLVSNQKLYSSFVLIYDRMQGMNAHTRIDETKDHIQYDVNDSNSPFAVEEELMCVHDFLVNAISKVVDPPVSLRSLSLARSLVNTDAIWALREIAAYLWRHDTHLLFASDWLRARPTFRLGVAEVVEASPGFTDLSTLARVFRGDLTSAHELPNPLQQRLTSHGLGALIPFIVPLYIDTPPTAVSFHLPYNRLFTAVALMMCRSYDISPSALFSRLFATSSGADNTPSARKVLFQQALLERPLRAVVLLSQCGASRWIRNGKSVWGASLIYSSSYWADHGMGLDTVLIQLVSLSMPADLLLSTMLSRFQAEPFFAIRSPALIEPRPLGADARPPRAWASPGEFLSSREFLALCTRYIPSYEHQCALDAGALDGRTVPSRSALGAAVYTLFTLLIHISSRHTRLFANDRDVLRREIIHRLCLSDHSYSGLSEKIPSRLGQHCEFESVLKEVSDYKQPRTGHAITQGLYSIKDSAWEEFDPFFFTYNQRERNTAQQRYKAVLARRNGPGPTNPLPTINMQSFSHSPLPTPCLNSRLLHSMLFCVLYNGLSGKETASTDAKEAEMDESVLDASFRLLYTLVGTSAEEPDMSPVQNVFDQPQAHPAQLSKASCTDLALLLPSQNFLSNLTVPLVKLPDSKHHYVECILSLLLRWCVIQPDNLLHRRLSPSMYPCAADVLLCLSRRSKKHSRLIVATYHAAFPGQQLPAVLASLSSAMAASPPGSPPASALSGEQKVELTAASEKEERRRRAKERQQALMAQFSAKQTAFKQQQATKHREDMSNHANSEEVESKQSREFECVICFQRCEASTEEPLGYLTLIEPTTILNIARPTFYSDHPRQIPTASPVQSSPLACALSVNTHSSPLLMATQAPGAIPPLTLTPRLSESRPHLQLPDADAGLPITWRSLAAAVTDSRSEKPVEARSNRHKRKMSSGEQRRSKRGHRSLSLTEMKGDGVDENAMLVDEELRDINVTRESVLHVSSCGHCLHLSCYKRFLRHQHLEAIQQPSIRRKLDPNTGELFCPLCRQLSNSLLPVVPFVPPLPTGNDTAATRLQEFECTPGPYVTLRIPDGDADRIRVSARENLHEERRFHSAVVRRRRLETLFENQQGGFDSALTLFLVQATIRVPVFKPQRHPEQQFFDMFADAIALEELAVRSRHPSTYDKEKVSVRGKASSTVLRELLHVSLVTNHAQLRHRMTADTLTALETNQSGSDIVVSTPTNALFDHVPLPSSLRRHINSLDRFDVMTYLNHSLHLLFNGVHGTDPSQAVSLNILDLRCSELALPLLLCRVFGRMLPQTVDHVTSDLIDGEPSERRQAGLQSELLRALYHESDHSFKLIVERLLLASAVQAAACISLSAPTILAGAPAHSLFGRVCAHITHVTPEAEPQMTLCCDLMRWLLLPMLRSAALLYSILRDLPYPSTPAPSVESSPTLQVQRRTPLEFLDRRACTSEFRTLSRFLELEHDGQIPTGNEDWIAEWCTAIPKRHATLVESWLSALRPPVPFPSRLLPQPLKLIELPSLFHVIYTRYLSEKCSKCSQVPVEPGLCLVCGSIVCVLSECCTESCTLGDRDERVGEARQHAELCGGGQGLFLLLRACVVLMLCGERRLVWGSLFLDDHGEEDMYLRRGKPLYLSEARYRELHHMWATCSLVFQQNWSTDSIRH